MMTAHTQVRALPTHQAAASAQAGWLQRKCACGGHDAGLDGECAECRKEKLQRRATRPDAPSTERSMFPNASPAMYTSPRSIPSPIVHEVLGSTGSPLDNAVRHKMQARFGHDFSRVRIHTDARAAESARAVNALAYTVGRDIVFDTGQYAPRSRMGQALLAHELAHTIQQSASDTAIPTRDVPTERLYIAGYDAAEREAEHAGVSFDRAAVTPHPRAVQRGFFSQIAGLFAGDDFKASELKAYLEVLDKGKIEDNTDSDNKARAIVKAWSAGSSLYDLTGKRMILLIQEMQSGFTGDDDEQAILTILNRAENMQLQIIFGPGGVDPKDLLSDFHGKEEDQLLAWYEIHFEGGVEAVKKGTAKFQWEETFGKEKVLVKEEEAKEVARIIKDIKAKYGIDLNTEQGIQGLKNRYTAVDPSVIAGIKKRTWRVEDLQALERALAHYAPLLGAERAKSTRAGSAQEVTSVGKIEQSIDKNTPVGKLDTTTMGEFFGDTKNYSIFKAVEGSDDRFPGDPKKQAEGVAVHELAHALIEYRIPDFVVKFKYWKSKYSADADPDTRVANKAGIEAPITFYGGTSAGEDLSEAAMYYFVEPDTLKNGRGKPQGTPGNPCPERFVFMQDTVKGWKPPPKPPAMPAGKKPAGPKGKKP